MQSTITINEAEVAFEKAKLKDAEAIAPYEYFSAKEYLYKAKEEWGYSDFEAALDYSELAYQFAEEAYKKAIAKGKFQPVAPVAPAPVAPSSPAPRF
jgi:hypothetical protein